MDIQTKDRANACYIFETDIAKLESALKDLASLCHEPWLSKENLDACTALGFRIKVKILSLKFYNELTTERFDALKGYIEKMLPVANERGYAKTVALGERSINYASKVYDIMLDFPSHKARVCDGDWKVTACSREEAEEVKRILEQKKEKILALSPAQEIFGDKVRFIDARATACEKLTTVIEFCVKIIADMAKEYERGLLSLCTFDVEKYGSYKYYPVISDGSKKANALVVCTPVDEEFLLYAYAQARSNPAGLLALNASLLSDKDDIKRIFNAIKGRGSDLAIVKANAYRGDFAEFYRAIVSFGKEGRKVFVLDETGNRKTYSEMLAFCTKTDGFTALDISFSYLSMPDYNEVVELFEKNEMLTTVSRERVKSGLAFMGFVGLNEAMESFALGRDWFMKGAEISRANEKEAKLYIASAPSQEQFIDKGWGDFDTDREVGNAHHGEFDYDCVREANRNNVRKIIESDTTLFAKCGLLVRYLIFHADDVSVWKTLSDEEREIRLNDATKAVMNALNLNIEPVVEIVKKFDHGTLVGRCCDGGKLIQYRADYVVNEVEDLLDTICHECYHAFQHMAINNPWREWYWNLLGVTQGSLNGVRENNRAYIVGNEKRFGEEAHTLYRIQVMECEARAFAFNCIEQSKNITIDWE